jgi:hypothetical protein
MPADLNERLMQRIEETEPARPIAKQKRLWLYAAIAVAASIALLIIFNFGQEQTSQESLVALRVGRPTTSVPEPVEGDVIEEPSNAASESVEAPAPQPSQKPAKKRQETVMKLVELIPIPEVEPALTAEAEPTPESATNAEEDPLVAMAAQLEDIRSRGQRLQQEITAIMNN